MKSNKEIMVLVKESINELNLQMNLLKIEMVFAINNENLQKIHDVSTKLCETSAELIKDLEHLEELEAIEV